MADITPLGESLKQSFLQGQGVITQGPGSSYSHRGINAWDIGVPSGTPVVPTFNGTVKNLGNQGIYGNRAQVVNSDTGETYLLSHLSSVLKNGQFTKGTPIAYTGGTKGAYGAGNSTGPHLDIMPGGSYSGAIRSIGQQAQQSMQNTGQKVNINALLSQAKTQYGNKLRMVTNSKAQADAYAKQKGYSVAKL